MIFLPVLFLLATGLQSEVAPASSPSGVLGDWKSPTASVVRVYPCQDAVCLKIVKLSASAASKVDGKNPDKGLRSRPLCGLTIGSGFHQADAAHLDGGHLYDPKSGHTYSGTIAAKGDELDLRGYIGIPLFGRSEVWHRSTAVDEKQCR
jgi:uncharacterized protein (DUF2147 family)